MRGKSSSVIETREEVYVLNLVLSLVQTTKESVSCSFREFSASLAETFGEKHETNRALVLALLETTGRDEELHTLYIGVLRFLAILLFSLLVTAPTAPHFFVVTDDAIFSGVAG
jgi:hypothetical protein